MRSIAVIIFLLLAIVAAPAQKTTPGKPRRPATSATPPLTESQEFEKARAVENDADRITALQAFLAKYPDSAEKPRAVAFIVRARARLGDQKLGAGDTAAGIALFKQAAEDLPTPIPDDLFEKVALGFPISLYAREQRAAAFEIAKMIEDKTAGNPAQLLDLAKFFIKVQYGTEAIRLATLATSTEAGATAAGFSVLAIANRLNFRLEDSAAAYARAYELDPSLTAAAASLAEVKRALGKPAEAVEIYRSLLEKSPDDKSFKAGLALALAESAKPGEAEEALAKAVADDPENASLLTAAAYWYARAGKNERAIELATKAVRLEPSSLFAYVAHGRALMAEGRPLEAERVLLAARKYADLPTLDYELASARLASGFFREAAETLARNFTINKDGNVETYLGNRILADAATFGELLSLERRVTIFETAGADDPAADAKLKALMVFVQKLASPETPVDELAAAAEAFAAGTDPMRSHRMLFAASRMIRRKDAAARVRALATGAVGGVDDALTVPSPSAAVMADELYDTRQYAIGQGLELSVTNIPRATLLQIIRGRIEDIAGQTYIEEGNRPQAIVRFRRALSVLPERSAFSRATWWRLGDLLTAEGNEKEALDAYLKSYNPEFPDYDRRAAIEALWIKVTGKVDGLEEIVGPKPAGPVAATPSATPDPAQTASPEPTPEQKPSPEPSPEPSPSATPEATPVTTPEPTPTTGNVVAEKPAPEADPTPGRRSSLPANVPGVSLPPLDVKPSPSPTPAPESKKPEEAPTVVATPTPERTPETTPEPSPEPTPEKTPETVPSPTPEAAPRTGETDPALPTATQRSAQFPPSPRTDRVRASADPTPSVKPAFDPVVIAVGAPETPKTDAQSKLTVVTGATEDSNKPAPESERKTEAEPKPETERKPETESKPEAGDDKTPPAAGGDKTPPGPTNGERRPRVIITDTSGGRNTRDEIATCRLDLLPGEISLIRDGGKLGVSVGFDIDADFRQITAKSSSPQDVEVVADPEMDAARKRAFFVVTSISKSSGIYSLTFEAPCGRKEVSVRVR